MDRRGRVLGAGSFCVCIVASFLAASQAMRARTARALADHFPRASTHDLVLTPMPANPLCWNFIAVQSDGAEYALRRGRAALFPRGLTAEDCPERPEEGTTAPLREVQRPDGPGLVWRGEFRAPLAELRQLAREHCGVAAFLRFARAPFFEQEAGSVLIGDLRYDRGSERGFAEIEFAAPPRDCPAALPPWRPPLADLL